MTANRHWTAYLQGLDVVPRAGSVLLFEHRLYHEGSLLVSGTKYAIRTDVMYTNKGKGWAYVERPLVLETDPRAGGAPASESGGGGSGGNAGATVPKKEEEAAAEAVFQLLPGVQAQRDR